jgi:putative ABC transport system permease protein
VTEKTIDLLLRLFPQEFGRRFRQHIRETVRDLERDVRGAGLPARTVFYLRIVFRDTLPALIRAWASQISHHRGNRSPSAKRRGDGLIHSLLRDARYAARLLVQKPGFTAVAVATLGLGIGVNTSIFSVVNGILLSPLPYPSPDRLVNVWQVNAKWFDSPNPSLRSWADEFTASMPVLEDWVELNPVFEAVGGFADVRFTVTEDDRPRTAWATQFTAGVSRALAVAPLLGRTFDDSDDQVGAPPVVLLSHEFWQQHFGGDSSVVGKEFRLTDTAYTIIGIMPAGFYFPGPGRSFWTNFDDQSKQNTRDRQWLAAVARLRPGVTVERAQREMKSVTQLIKERTGGAHEYGVRVVPRIDQVVGDVRPILLVLLGAVGLVLLIACANIANLLLVRASQRRRELAIRSALGAWRGRLIRQLLMESLVLSVLSGAAGLLLAWATFKPLLKAMPPGLPRLGEVQLDLRVMGFGMAAAVLTGVIVGILPAVRGARTDVAKTLQDTSRGMTGGRRRHLTQNSLVVAEIALAFVLFTAAGLLIESFTKLTSVERGFDAEGVLTASVNLTGSVYEDENAREAFVNRLSESVNAVPGVIDVAYADNMPFSGGTSSSSATVENSAGVVETNLQRSRVSAFYFRSLGIPIVAGRPFTAADDKAAEAVTIVSQAMADAYWPGENPLGRRVKLSTGDADNDWLRVVGVAADVRHQALSVDPAPKLYTPFGHRIKEHWPRIPQNFSTVVRVRGDPQLATDVVQNAVAGVDPSLARPSARILERVIHQSVATPRFRTQLLSLLALLAGVLAVTGIYGVLAYTMSQRTAEIGIRLALGARHGDVIRSVLRHGATLTAIGLSIGLAIALITVRAIQSFMYQTDVHDPVLFGSSIAVMAAAALLASYLPARRATKVDPLESLRAQ